MSKLQLAENFAKKNQLQHEHLAGIVARLKNLGITDEDVLSAAWLCHILDQTQTSFDELDQRFGSRTAVIVLSLSKDRRVARSKQEEVYIKQLKESPLDSKLIKFCDIAANLKDLKNSAFSKTKRLKEVKRNLFYLNSIKLDLIKNKSQVPGIINLLVGINDILVEYGLRPINF